MAINQLLGALGFKQKPGNWIFWSKGLVVVVAILAIPVPWGVVVLNVRPFIFAILAVVLPTHDWLIGLGRYNNTATPRGLSVVSRSRVVLFFDDSVTTNQGRRDQ
jgi:hypothetical protein